MQEFSSYLFSLIIIIILSKIFKNYLEVLKLFKSIGTIISIKTIFRSIKSMHGGLINNLNHVSCLIISVACILYPVFSVLYPGSCILYPVSCILYPVSCILHPVFSILYPVSWILYPGSWILYRVSCIVYPVYCIVYPVSNLQANQLLESISITLKMNLRPRL